MAKSIIRIFLSLLVFLNGCSIPTTDLPHPQPSSTVLLPGLSSTVALTEMNVVNEAELAQAIAQASYSQAAPLETVQPFGAKEFHELFPLAVVTTSPKSFEPPPVFFDGEASYGSLHDKRFWQWVGASLGCQQCIFFLPVFALAGVIHGAVETSINKASTIRKREENPDNRLCQW